MRAWLGEGHYSFGRSIASPAIVGTAMRHVRTIAELANASSSKDPASSPAASSVNPSASMIIEFRAR